MTQRKLMKECNYTAGFEPAEEGGFVVTFPALPGLVTEGDTLEEARAMAIDALRGYLESLAKDGAAPPNEDSQPSMPLIRENVAVSA
jgi:antitoxin HicB